MVLQRQQFVRVRVRSLVEEGGEWGATKKSWEDASGVSPRRFHSLAVIEGDRRLRRMGAEYSADWHGFTMAKPAIDEGDLVEVLDSDDSVMQRLIVKKVLPRGRYVSVMLEENPNIQE